MEPHSNDVNHNDEENDVENLGESDGREEEKWSTLSERNMSMRMPLLRKRTNTTSQIAVIGANACPIESLDYEMIENELFKQDWRGRKKVQIFQYVFLKWGLALLIGLTTGLIGFFNNIAVENISGFKLLLTNKLMLQGSYFKAFLAFAGLNITFAAAAGSLCAFLAPAAAGSGIPEVKAYLNGVDAPSILAPSTLFVKIFGSVLGVSAGFVVGKEGPMVHTGACIANLLGQGGSRKYGLTWNWLRYFKNDRDRRDLITCGAAAGVAAAFRAPVGGVLFALEEAASWWRSALLWRTFFTTAVVAIVLRSLIQYCWNGKCGLFGQGGLIMYDVSKEVSSYGSYDILAVIVLGLIGGVLGSFYNYLVDKVLRTYSVINEKGPSFRVLLVIIISVLTTCCAFGLPWLVSCTPCPTDTTHECPTIGEIGHYKSFQCPPGSYNDLASLFLTTSDDAIRNLFSNTIIREFQMSSLYIFFVTIYFLGIITYGIAVPAGLFIPVILAGSVYGRIVGRVFHSVSVLDTGLFSLLGAASFLGGTMRMTVSLCVILLELTNNLLLLPLVMIVLLISKSVADCFNRGVYDQIVKLKGLPYLEAHAEPYMKHLVACDAVSGPLVTFSGLEKVETIVHALQSTGHNGFPVIGEPPFSESPELCGLVLRSHLLVLLKAKYFSKERRLSGRDILNKFSPSDFAKPGTGKGLKLEDISLTEEEMDMYIDLHPITNASPYTVLETMSLAKAMILFRQLGLRHMCVVPKSQGRPPIVGILTRHDFMSEHILGLYPHMRQHK
ncbi:chloride channel protein CLC-c-like [Chenopodium quinoa]|uniref:Chloride channel protein n=1 Tax=Chenopodium quinoa TaxID=63459 RepID=A0A803KNG8_CHEQI|nr:chloride channel protein CLC-c-like [Chenopodium quinoa]XP_021772663.1 chloride channel protein CLC-c-like [Chenopodium quinoa]